MQPPLPLLPQHAPVVGAEAQASSIPSPLASPKHTVLSPKYVPPPVWQTLDVACRQPPTGSQQAPVTSHDFRHWAPVVRVLSIVTALSDPNGCPPGTPVG